MHLGHAEILQLARKRSSAWAAQAIAGKASNNAVTSDAALQDAQKKMWHSIAHFIRTSARLFGVGTSALTDTEEVEKGKEDEKHKHASVQKELTIRNFVNASVLGCNHVNSEDDYGRDRWDSRIL